MAIPSGYVKPEGSIDITENGAHNVAGKAEVVVNVPTPEGSVKGVSCTQAEYDAWLAAGTIDSNTIYAIVG